MENLSYSNSLADLFLLFSGFVWSLIHSVHITSSSSNPLLQLKMISGTSCIWNVEFLKECTWLKGKKCYEIKFFRGFLLSELFKEFAKGFRNVSKGFTETFPRFKAFLEGFKAFLKGFQKVSKRFSKGFQSVSNGLLKRSKRVSVSKGFLDDLKPEKTLMVDKTCFRMDLWWVNEMDVRLFAFSSQEATIYLVSTKIHDFWVVPTPEVWDSPTTF